MQSRQEKLGHVGPEATGRADLSFIHRRLGDPGIEATSPLSSSGSA